MEIVTSYKATDGKTFETKQECLAHEARITAQQQGLETFLQGLNLPEDETSRVRNAILDWEVHKQEWVPAGYSLDVLDLPVRTLYVLRESKIRSLEALVSATEDDLLRLPNIGRKSLNEIKEKLGQLGMALRA